MNVFWLFLHMFATTIWIGGGLAVMVAGIAMKKMDRSVWGGVVDAQAAVYRMLIGPGAMLSVASGVILTFEMYNRLAVKVAPGMSMMQGLGLLGALVILLGSVPLVGKLSRLEPMGPDAPQFDRLRVRLAIFGATSGTLGLLALLAGSYYRYGG
jgi:hypothetical protein